MTDLGVPVAEVWWLLFGFFVLCEILTGTFYLLMLAAGAAAGALLAHAGVSLVVQQVGASLCAVASLGALWHLKKTSKIFSSHKSSETSLDVGGVVAVASWSADRSTMVPYRGANWAADLAPGLEPSPGLHRIESINGSRLVLTKVF